MPKKLSLQNAKKQVVEYMIYIITMSIPYIQIKIIPFIKKH